MHGLREETARGERKWREKTARCNNERDKEKADDQKGDEGDDRWNRDVSHI